VGRRVGCGACPFLSGCSASQEAKWRMVACVFGECLHRALHSRSIWSPLSSVFLLTPVTLDTGGRGGGGFLAGVGAFTPHQQVVELELQNAKVRRGARLNSMESSGSDRCGQSQEAETFSELRSTLYCPTSLFDVWQGTVAESQLGMVSWCIGW
jgi:hypothetical protein